FETYPIESSIVADVSFYDESINDFLRASSRFMLLTHETEVPFVNRYLSPETLGKDRIALAAGAVDIFPDENVLAIDAGTCITYDFISAEKEYLGGSISPGLSMKFKALHNYTARLPLLKRSEERRVGKEVWC